MRPFSLILVGISIGISVAISGTKFGIENENEDSGMCRMVGMKKNSVNYDVCLTPGCVKAGKKIFSLFLWFLVEFSFNFFSTET